MIPSHPRSRLSMQINPTNSLHNEIINEIRANQTPKNSFGSLLAESSPSLATQTLPTFQSHTKRRNRQCMVDLTEDEDGSYNETPQENSNAHPPSHKRTPKKPRRSNEKPHSQEKSVHWKTAEIASFNPQQPVTSAFNRLTPNISKQDTAMPPFCPPPPPLPTLHTYYPNNYITPTQTTYPSSLQHHIYPTPTHPTFPTQQPIMPQSSLLPQQPSPFHPTFQLHTTPPQLPQQSQLQLLGYPQISLPQDTPPANTLQHHPFSTRKKQKNPDG